MFYPWLGFIGYNPCRLFNAKSCYICIFCIYMIGEQYKIILFLNGSEIICLHTFKRFQVLLSYTNNSTSVICL